MTAMMRATMAMARVFMVRSMSRTTVGDHHVADSGAVTASNRSAMLAVGM